MEITFTEDEIKKLETKLSLRFDADGIYYNGVLIDWNEVDEIRNSATRSEMPSTRLISWENLCNHAARLERELTDARAALADRGEEYTIRLEEAEENLESARTLIKKLREERDRYKADSEALDWIFRNGKGYVKGMLKFYEARALAGNKNNPPPEHLRKRLEGKKT